MSEAALFIFGLFAAFLISLFIAVFSDVTVRDLPKCPHIHEVLKPKNAAERLMIEGRYGDGCDSVHHPEELDVGALKNGDILLLSYEGIRTIFSKTFYRSSWTHPGMVWIDPSSGEPHILEIAAYKEPFHGTVIRVPLSNWMRINRNSRAVGLLSINKPLSPEAMDVSFRFYEERDVGVEGLTAKWLRFYRARDRSSLSPENIHAYAYKAVQPRHKSHSAASPIVMLANALPVPEKVKPRGSTMFGYTFDYVVTCHEMIVNVLQRCGAVDHSISPDSFTPKSVAERRLPMINGYAYAPIKHVSMANHVLIFKV